IPFTDVFIHAVILDGKGQRMSKSKGNGIDPVDIISTYGADAMRFTLAQMTTESQDIRMPVEQDDQGRHTSTKFDIGRNFCNKLWNAGRFALMNLAEFTDEPLDRSKLLLEDRWILSRIEITVEEATKCLESFRFHDCIDYISTFFWSDFCDWYLEITKPRMREAATRGVPQRILAYALDRLLRILHPFVPHITEALWQHLNAVAPDRSLDAEAPAPASEACTAALWPQPVVPHIDLHLIQEFGLVQNVIRMIRNIRARAGVAPRTPLKVLVNAPEGLAAMINHSADTVRSLATVDAFTVGPNVQKPPASMTEVSGGIEVYMPLAGVIDLETERERLRKRIAEQQKFRDGSRKKLSNENFVARAKPEVVQAERDRLEKIESELAALEANLKDLA
ncbi:MAG: class I tRNA ligase family protein, partial [Planctomycetes bacterium]|nr:class I tRNA ligase family protein [Planctomycetota bacterium]